VNPRALALALLLEAALVISWSAGFVGIRFAIDYAPIFSILLWRSLVSGLLLLPLALTRGPRLQGKDVLSQMAFGALAMSGYLGCFAFSIAQGVPTGLVALITDMLPLVVALLSLPVLGQALNGRQWLGTGIGLLGVVVASGITTRTGDAPLWAYLLPVLGTASLALATLLQKGSASNTMPVYQKLSIQCLSAAAMPGRRSRRRSQLRVRRHLSRLGAVLHAVQALIVHILSPEDGAKLLRHAVHRRVGHGQFVLRRNFGGCNGAPVGQVQHPAQTHHVQTAVHQIGGQAAAQDLVHFKQGDGGDQQLVAVLNRLGKQIGTVRVLQVLNPARRIDDVHSNSRSGSFSGSMSPRS
jgi:hypothetical protein